MSEMLLSLLLALLTFCFAWRMGLHTGRVIGALTVLQMLRLEIDRHCEQRATPAGLAASVNDTAPSPPDCEIRCG